MEKDGLQLEEFRVNGDRAQIVFRTTPQVSPVFCAARVKGRLQHALRQAGTGVKFSRKVSSVIAKKKGYRLKSVSVMPDHLHAALGGDIDQSPEEITLAFLNNLAYLLGRNRFWRDGYYVGTFSEYDMCIVRQLAREDQNHWWR